MSIRTRTRIVLVLITPSIRSVQQLAISHCIISIWLVSTRRPTAIWSIRFVLLSMADLNWPLSLQFWQTLKMYVNLYLFLLCLYDLVIIFRKTCYLFLCVSQCICQIRRVPRTSLLIWCIGSFYVVYHLASHLVSFLQCIICQINQNTINQRTLV